MFGPKYLVSKMSQKDVVLRQVVLANEWRLVMHEFVIVHLWKSNRVLGSQLVGVAHQSVGTDTVGPVPSD